MVVKITADAGDNLDTMADIAITLLDENSKVREVKFRHNNDRFNFKQGVSLSAYKEIYPRITFRK